MVSTLKDHSPIVVSAGIFISIVASFPLMDLGTSFAAHLSGVNFVFPDSSTSIRPYVTEFSSANLPKEKKSEIVKEM